MQWQKMHNITDNAKRKYKYTLSLNINIVVVSINTCFQRFERSLPQEKLLLFAENVGVESQVVDR